MGGLHTRILQVVCWTSAGGAMILYRPVGLPELVLVYKTGLRKFPPRLPEQPIFYPVLSLSYAKKIARDWNTKGHLFAGYVTELDLNEVYAKSLKVHQVGASQHRELWIAAEALEEFNHQIEGQIRVIAAYFATTFVGLVPEAFSLRGKNAREQLAALWGIYNYSLLDFHAEVTASCDAVFAHYPYWEQILGAQGSNPEIDVETLLPAIRKAWSSAFPEIPLGIQRSRAATGPE